MSTEARRPVLRIGTYAVRTLLIAAIAITLFVAYGLVDNAWYHVLAVRGGSMEPAISAGDLIVITRPPERIEVGQVLTLQVDGSIVTHRVVEVRRDGTFVTRGDANDARDDFSANAVHVVGEYRFSLPLLGMIVDPIVSGAWFGDGRDAESVAGSGTWETLSAIGPAGGGGIVWSAPEGVTAPSPSAPSIGAGPGTPSPTSASPSMLPTPAADASARPTVADRPMPSPMPAVDPAARESPASEACASPFPTPSASASQEAGHSPPGEACPFPTPSASAAEPTSTVGPAP